MPHGVAKRLEENMNYGRSRYNCGGKQKYVELPKVYQNESTEQDDSGSG